MPTPCLIQLLESWKPDVTATDNCVELSGGSRNSIQPCESSPSVVPNINHTQGYWRICVGLVIGARTDRIFIPLTFLSKEWSSNRQISRFSSRNQDDPLHPWNSWQLTIVNTSNKIWRDRSMTTIPRRHFIHTYQDFIYLLIIEKVFVYIGIAHLFIHFLQFQLHAVRFNSCFVSGEPKSSYFVSFLRMLWWPNAHTLKTRIVCLS